MRQLFLLLKVYCRGFFHGSPGRIGGRFGKQATALLTLLVYGMFAGYTIALGVGLRSVGMLRLYPGLVMAASCLMTLLTSVSRAPGTLFRAKDFDLVMSLPMPGWAVAMARLLELYAYELLFSLAILLPAGGTYAWFVRPGPGFYPLYIAGTLLAPMLPVFVGAALGALVHMASAAFRSSRIVSLVLTFAVTLGVMGVSYSMGFVMGEYTPAQLMRLADTVADMTGRIYPPARLFARAVTEGSLPAFLAFAGLSLGVFALLAWAFGRWFVRLNTLVNARHTRSDYRLREARVRSPRRALLWREIRRYFASNVYVLNTSIGLVLSLAGVVALAVFRVGRLTALLELTGYEGLVSMMVPVFTAFLVSTACTTGCSISLEGKSLWILKGLPTPAMDLLMAKVELNLLVSLPIALADGIILAVTLRITPLAALLALLLPLGAAVFTALMGLVCNLRWHRFDWTNETTVVKQSLASFLGPFVAILLLLGCGVLTAVLPAMGHGLVPLATAAVFFLADAGLFLLLRRKGEAWFRAL